MQMLHNVLPAQQTCTKHHIDGASRQGLFKSQLTCCRQCGSAGCVKLIGRQSTSSWLLWPLRGCNQAQHCWSSIACGMNSNMSAHTTSAARHDRARQQVSEARRHPFDQAKGIYQLLQAD